MKKDENKQLASQLKKINEQLNASANRAGLKTPNEIAKFLTTKK